MLADDVTSALKETLSPEEGVLEAVFIFDEGLDLFKGHFPGNALVPGILQIEMVRQVARKALGKALVIREVSKAKFAGPVRPGERVSVTVRLVGDADEFKAAAKLSVDGEVKSNIMLILAGGGVAV